MAVQLEGDTVCRSQSDQIFIRLQFCRSNGVGAWIDSRPVGMARCEVQVTHLDVWILWHFCGCGVAAEIELEHHK